MLSNSPWIAPPHLKKSLSLVFLLGLTPPGVSTSEVLLFQINYIVEIKTVGTDGWDPGENRMKKFIDVVA